MLKDFFKDIVLGQYSEGVTLPSRLLVGECKRANPALSNWIFTRAPFVRRGGVRKEMLVENIVRSGQELVSCMNRLVESHRIFHLAFPVKQDRGNPAQANTGKKKDGNKKGDHPAGSTREVIEEAATQVTRGVNGLIECIAKNRHPFPERFAVEVIPVIFTTARLLVSDVDLSTTDLIRGEIDIQEELRDEPWLWFQYHVSPGLKHSVGPIGPYIAGNTPQFSLGNLLEEEYTRSIAIVSAGGIEEFLTNPRWKS